MPPVDNQPKAQARRFLEGLSVALSAELPPLDELRRNVRKIAVASKRGPESVFLNEFVIPKISRIMQTVEGIDKAGARRALLSEGFHNPNLSQYCSGTPSRSLRHPFTKIIDSNAPAIVRKWRGAQGSPLTQACPDLAFREPFPFKIVFEGKYFEKGSADKAARELASNVYQAFFYRALPFAPPSRSGAPWDYDYACLLACDASLDGALLAAWNAIAKRVRDGFWEGANLYVMILRSHADRTLPYRAAV